MGGSSGFGRDWEDGFWRSRSDQKDSKNIIDDFKKQLRGPHFSDPSRQSRLLPPRPPTNKPDEELKEYKLTWRMEKTVEEISVMRDFKDHFFIELEQAYITDHGVDPLALNLNRFMMSVVNGNVSEVKSFLNDKSIHPNIVNHKGWTPLCIAAARGHNDIVNMLLDTLMVHRDHHDHVGMTALHYASFFGRTDVVQTLLDRHVDFTLQAENGQTAFNMAQGVATETVFSEHKRFQRYLRQQALINRARVAQEQIVAPDIQDDLDQGVYKPEQSKGLRGAWDQTVSEHLILLLANLSALGQSEDASERVVDILKTHMKDSTGAVLDEMYEAGSRTLSTSDWAEIFVQAAEDNALHLLSFLQSKENFAVDKGVMRQAKSKTTSRVVYKALQKWQRASIDHQGQKKASNAGKSGYSRWDFGPL